MIKLTKKVALEVAMNAVHNHVIREYSYDDATFTADEVEAKLMEMFNALEKKSSGEKALTEQQKANIGFKEDIYNFLAVGEEHTATEILHGVPTFPKDMTNQRVSALLRQLILEGKVEKEIRKGKAYFSTVEGV